MKHDMKILSRTLLLLHAFALIFALIGRLFVINMIHSQGANMLRTTYMLMFFFIIVVVATATQIIIGVHFYKSLFSTQGYLTWTLPVTANQHLLSKLLTAFLWNILDFALLAIAAILFYGSFSDLVNVVIESFQYMETAWLPLIANTVLFFVLATLSSILTLYMSATIGQLFTNHRIIASIATYGIFTVIAQFVYTMVLFSTAQNSYIMDVSTAISPSTTLYFRIMLIVNTISFIQVVLFYVVIHYLTRRKLNLA